MIKPKTAAERETLRLAKEHGHDVNAERGQTRANQGWTLFSCRTCWHRAFTRPWDATPNINRYDKLLAEDCQKENGK